MRAATLLLGLTMLTGAAARADTISSAYTELDTQADCVTFAAAAEDEGGDWANLVCAGYKGYPVIVYYGDGRESLFYGFPPGGDLAPAWESFAGFNSTGPTVEWRIAREGAVETPFATIHRWFVADPEDPDSQTQILVVEKVGQLGEREGCAVGLVVASGNPGANEAARRIADEEARAFACGVDERIVVEGGVPLPGFTRAE